MTLPSFSTGSSSNTNLINNSIASNNATVNNQSMQNTPNNTQNSQKSSFSLSENSTDNQGRQLTKGQKEYFKNSKAIDEKGNLKVVYHGSNANFTEFKRNYNFFTDNEDIAKTYTKNDMLYKGYINIERPFTIDACGRSFEELEIDSIDFGKYSVDDLINEYGISTYKNDGKRLENTGSGRHCHRPFWIDEKIWGELADAKCWGDMKERQNLP